jgi:hypothetical protein
MPNIFEYALMAGDVYDGVRSDLNDIPIPQGWERLRYVADDTTLATPPFETSTETGFSAGVFKNSATGEIVISFTGTNETIDWRANIALGLGGVLTRQLSQAIELVLDVKAANLGASITFTGHSLGGGLASLMGVFFNRSATVFASAPFAIAALNRVTVSTIQTRKRGQVLNLELRSNLRTDSKQI